MRVILITPENTSIEIIDVSSKYEISSLIGFDTLESDELGTNGDRLYFDEECFIRGDAVKGHFQVDTLIPFAGKGAVIGSAAGSEELTDALIDVMT